MNGLRHGISICIRIAAIVVLLTLIVLPWRANAVPSYTRQTGQPCTACNMNYPELTSFGRAFKLGGYTLCTGESTFPPPSAVVQTAFTHTEAPQPGGATPHFGPPTVEDIYNTTMAVSFPFASAGLAPRPAAMTLLDNLPFHVGGAGAYAMWNTPIYGAITLYKSFPHDFQRFAGINTSTEPEIDSVAPYWRLAWQREWDEHSVEAGTFGMFANTFPNRIHGAATDRFVDLGFDAQYQFRGDPHSASFRSSWIHEYQRLDASRALGLAANSSNTLDTFKLKTSYLYQDTYGATVAYFCTSGSADTGLFAPAPITGSANGKPNSNGWIFELDWLPFVHSPLEFAPWAQTKLSLQYVAYNKFNGGSHNYDGIGRNASDNNTVFLLAWFAF